jgi:hypothetical protein
VRYTSIRKVHAREVHAHEMHACEVHAHKVHACEMQMTPMQIDAPQCLKHEGVLALEGVGKGVVPSHSASSSISLKASTCQADISRENRAKR